MGNYITFQEYWKGCAKKTFRKRMTPRKARLFTHVNRIYCFVRVEAARNSGARINNRYRFALGYFRRILQRGRLSKVVSKSRTS